MGRRVASPEPKGSGKSRDCSTDRRLPLDGGRRALGPGVVVGEGVQERTAFEEPARFSDVFGSRCHRWSRRAAHVDGPNSARRRDVERNVIAFAGGAHPCGTALRKQRSTTRDRRADESLICGDRAGVSSRDLRWDGMMLVTHEGDARGGHNYPHLDARRRETSGKHEPRLDDSPRITGSNGTDRGDAAVGGSGRRREDVALATEKRPPASRCHTSSSRRDR